MKNNIYYIYCSFDINFYSNMDLIISSIQNTINSPELRNAPIMIYIGVGTFAGLKTNINGQMVLEDKNYHQFPPCVQKIFSENSKTHLFIILIDPSQEDPIYMSTDRQLNQRLFQSDWIHINDTTEVYINNRISVYPFRKAIKTRINDHHFDESIVDITDNLFQLNRISIENDITFLYHDFSGQDTPKLLEKYFDRQIQNNLDHIIYGIGGGYINGCYYDFTSPEAFFATTIEYESRPVIKVFSIIKKLNEFNFLKETGHDVRFEDFIGFEIEKYGFENVESIMTQISNLKEDFKFKFKNYIIYILRILKEYNYEEKKDSILDLNYYLNRIDTDKKIRSLIELRDPNLFEKTIEIFAEMFKNEIKIMTVGTTYENFSCNELILMVTTNEDKYKWFDAFNQIFN